MSDNVRNILLRALFEPEFHNQLLTNAEAAVAGYNLTDEERRAILKPSADLYGLLTPAEGARLAPGRQVFAEPPTTTTIVAVIVVVAIVVFVAAVGATDRRGVDLEALQPLIAAIKNTQGTDRMKLVTTLVNELTREH